MENDEAERQVSWLSIGEERQGTAEVVSRLGFSATGRADHQLFEPILSHVAAPRSCRRSQPNVNDDESFSSTSVPEILYDRPVKRHLLHIGSKRRSGLNSDRVGSLFKNPLPR